MTMEAVVGEEMYRAHEHYPENAPSYNATLPFIRNVVGAVDYTPTAFSNHKYPHLTSYAHELALPVVFESGWVHFVDDVETYRNLPVAEKEFLKSVPADWDDIRFISGYPGKDAVLARRKGEDWYLAGINGEKTPKSLSIDLSFLDTGKYSMVLFTDGNNPEEIDSKRSMLGSKDILEISMAAFGGFAARISRQLESDE